MDAELLKKACEVAGMGVEDIDGTPFAVHGVGVCLQFCHPALPSYVASLLVAKVPERSGKLDMTNERIADAVYEGWRATDEQRIRAALEVLG